MDDFEGLSMTAEDGTELLDLITEEVAMSLGVARAKADLDQVERLNAEMAELLRRRSEQ